MNSVMPIERYGEDITLRWMEYIKTLVNVEIEREETDMINKTGGPVRMSPESK